MNTIEALASVGHRVIAPIAHAARFLPTTHAKSLALALPLAVAACSVAAPTNESVDATQDAIQNGDLGFTEPGIVYIHAPTPLHPRATCTGVMLTNTWLVTARHCVQDEAGNVAENETVLIQGDEDDNQIQSGAADVRLHDEHDVALIQLRRPWRLNGSTTGYLRELTPNMPSELVGWPMFCAGFGEAGPGDQTARLRSFASVLSAPSFDESFFFVHKNELTNQVHRRGDSGGGCFAPLGALVGIASAVDDANAPTVTTLVSVHIVRDWIAQNVPGY